MPDQEKEKTAAAVPPTETPAAAPPAAAPPPAAAKTSTITEEASSQYFFGEPLVGFDPSEITGNLIVIEGMDGSGRSTQIALPGVAGIGRLRRADERTAPFESCGARY